MEFCGTGNVMFHTQQKNALSRSVAPSVTTVYIRTCYEEVKKKVISFYDGESLSGKNVNSLMSFLS